MNASTSWTMKIVNFLKRVFRRGTMPLTSPTQRLLNMLAMTEGGEISCDQVFAVLEQYAEAVLHDQDARRLWPQVEKHLEMCSDCCEDYEGLLAMLQAPA